MNIGAGNPLNVAQNIIIDGEDILIPKNLPTFIIGSKNSGKSTFISTLIKACSSPNNRVYKRIFYVYTDHVDTTLAETCHETLIRIPLRQSIKFLTEYFKIKSEYMSWIKFINANNLDEDGPLPSIEELTKVYTDNIIDEFIRKKLNINESIDKVSQLMHKPNAEKPIMAPNMALKQHAIDYVLKYSDKFTIKVDDVAYHMEGLDFAQFDQLIIDDVGVAKEYLFPTSVDKSPLYRFLTISRHILLGTIVAGQDTLQLPKYARKEVNTYMYGIGVNIPDVKSTNIPSNKADEIIKMYDELHPYDFINYNGVDNVVTYMKCS